MRFARFVGLRFMRPKRRQMLLSIISLIALTGVAVGVATLIVVLSVITGFQEDMTNKILGTLSHMLVLSHNGRIEDWEPLVDKIRGVEGIEAATPFVYGEVMAATAENASGMILRGIDPATAAGVTSIVSSIKQGKLELLRGEQAPLQPPLEGGGEPVKYPGIILGHDLMVTLRVFPGEELTIVNPIGDVGPFGVAPKTKKFVVVGEFQSGLYEFDAKFAYIDLGVAQQFFSSENTVSGIELRLKDIWQADAVGARLHALLGWPFFTKDWKTMNSNLFSALKLEKLVMFIILCLIIFVASLNIFSVLYMMVMDKQKSIAMLRAMGASAGQIRRLFMVQGMFIGVLGSLIGAGLGIGICLLQMRYHLVALDPRVYFIDTLPMTFKVADFALIFASSLALNFVATVIPARIASKLDPVKTLRYE
ncbi:MAG: FtsX-like permease family protein [Myxococcales bacterium]|nr:FtsX-like permease family protein [Myxococcales bacterium]